MSASATSSAYLTTQETLTRLPDPHSPQERFEDSSVISAHGQASPASAAFQIAAPTTSSPDSQLNMQLSQDSDASSEPTSTPTSTTSSPRPCSAYRYEFETSTAAAMETPSIPLATFQPLPDHNSVDLEAQWDHHVLPQQGTRTQNHPGTTTLILAKLTGIYVKYHIFFKIGGAVAVITTCVTEGLHLKHN